MLSDPFVLFVVGAFPLHLVQLGVIDSFGVPFWIVTPEVSPATVSLLILATSRATIATIVLLVGRFHDQLPCEQARIV